MEIPQKCDVVVVGGGPAGSMVSTMLAQKGHHVVLFDKQRHPRYTVGESLIPDFWKYTDAIGVSDRIRAEGFMPKSGGLVTWDGQHKLLSFAKFGYTEHALHVERDCFDNILLTYAKEQGVEVYEEVTVRDVAFSDSNPVTATCHYRSRQESGEIVCQYVVDASGQNALLGHQLGLRKINEAFRFLSIWGYFKGGRYMDVSGKAQPMENHKHIPPTTYVTSLKDFRHVGWSWHIPLRDKVSVGIIIPVKDAKQVKAQGMSWAEFFEQKCRQIPGTRELLEGATFCADSVANDTGFFVSLNPYGWPRLFPDWRCSGFY